MVRYRVSKRSLIVSAAAVGCVWLSSPRSAADDAPAAHGGGAEQEQKTTASTPVRAQPKSKPSQETKSNAATQAPAIDVHAALLRGHREGAKWVASAGDDRRIELTLAPGLQEKAREVFNQYRVPYGAVAAIEPSSGRLLAYLGHSLEAPR